MNMVTDQDYSIEQHNRLNDNDDGIDLGRAMLNDLGMFDFDDDDDDNASENSFVNLADNKNDIIQQDEDDIDNQQNSSFINKRNLKDIWQYRGDDISKLANDFDLSRPVCKEDIEYLSNNHYPYLKLRSDAPFFDMNSEVNFIALHNSWVLFDYKEMLVTSNATKNISNLSEINAKNFGEYFENEDSINTDDDIDEEDSDSGSGDYGTIVRQQFEAVLAMIEIAKINGWDRAIISEGSSSMKFYAWVIAQKLGLRISGFIPNEDDERRYKIMTQEKVVDRAIQKMKKRYHKKFVQPENRDSSLV